MTRISMLVRLGVLSLLLVLTGCFDEVEFRPKHPGEASWTVIRRAAYSYKLPEKEEQLGTIIDSRLGGSIRSDDSGRVLERKVIEMEPKGYHKNSMARELEKKIALRARLDSNGIPIAITGYDSIYAVLSAIEHKKEKWRQEFLRSLDTATYKARFRDYWRLVHLLEPGTYLLEQAHPVERINQSLETVTLDSIRLEGTSPSGECLRYSVYYQKLDSLPLLVEQFLGYPEEHWIYQKYLWDKSVIHAHWRFAVRRDNGLPCYDELVEAAEVVFKHPEGVRQIPVTLFTYEENSYQF